MTMNAPFYDYEGPFSMTMKAPFYDYEGPFSMTRISSGWVDEHVLVQLSPDITCNTLNATTGLISNTITIAGSTSPATVAVTGSGEFSQDLTAKSIKLTGAQLPIVNTLDVAGSCNIAGDCNITGALSLNSVSIGSDINYTNPTQTSIVCKKSLVLGQTLDILGSSYLILQNREGINGALFKTTDTLNYIVDLHF